MTGARKSCKATKADTLVYAKGSRWELYFRNKKNEVSKKLRFPKGKTNAKGLAKWLRDHLGYNAVVLHKTKDSFLVGELGPVKVGAQGVILKNSASLMRVQKSLDVVAIIEKISGKGRLGVYRIVLANDAPKSFVSLKIKLGT